MEVAVVHLAQYLGCDLVIRLAGNPKQRGLVATGIVLLSLAQAVSESAVKHSSSLSIFPEEIKLSASGVQRVLVTATGMNAAERDVSGKAAFRSNHRDVAERRRLNFSDSRRS